MSPLSSSAARSRSLRLRYLFSMRSVTSILVVTILSRASCDLLAANAARSSASRSNKTRI
ncbi:hypothetical protein DIPPA_28519 [Diplonema papillatum]|nr:hypothetical protein DIPPA_28519 [Diplonema papillatum]